MATAVAAARRDLLQLAAQRTRDAAQQMVERDRARRHNAMKPYVLAESSLVQVSFLHSPTVRGLLKTAFQRHMSRTYTEEVYRVTRVALAPRSRSTFLYDAEAVDTSLEDGQQQATQARPPAAAPHER